MCWATAPKTSELFRTRGETTTTLQREHIWGMFVRGQSSKSCQMRTSKFQAQHARGTTYKLGTSKPDHLQLQVMSTTAGTFCISDFQRWKVLLQKETLSPQPCPPSLRGEDQAVMEAPVSQLSALWKGLPLPLPVRADQENQAADGSTSSFSLLERLPPLGCVWASWVLEEFSLPQQPNCISVQFKWMLHMLPFIEQYHQSLRLEI